MVCNIFYTHRTNGKCAGVCACDHTHQMENTVTYSFFELGLTPCKAQ